MKQDKIYLTTWYQEERMRQDKLPDEVKCIILDGPQEQYDNEGNDVSCYFLFYGDLWGEPLGNGRKFYNYEALQEEGERLAKTYQIELVNDAIPF